MIPSVEQNPTHRALEPTHSSTPPPNPQPPFVQDRLVSSPSCCCDSADFIRTVLFAILSFPFRVLWKGISTIFDLDNECCAPNAASQETVQYDPVTGRVLGNEPSRPSMTIVLPPHVQPGGLNPVLARFHPDRFELHPSHFHVVEGAEIPPADPRIRISLFKDFLTELKAFDRAVLIDSYMFNQRVDQFEAGSSINGYHMSAQYIAKARNTMRHLAAYFLRQKAAFPEESEARTTAERLYFKQLKRVLQELAGAFDACVNRISTFLQDFYYDLIGNDPDLMTKLTFENKAQRILMSFRKTIFDQAIVNQCQQGDPASTLNAYYARYGEEYGIPNDLSRDDPHYNRAGIGYDSYLQAAFGNARQGGAQYNVPAIVEMLRSRFQNPHDLLVSATEFTHWYRIHLPAGVSDYDVFGEDYAYHPELIVYFLWTQGIVAPKSEFRPLTGDVPPPADPQRMNMRIDQLVNVD